MDFSHCDFQPVTTELLGTWISHCVTSNLLQNPNQTLVQHPEHARLYLEDPLSGGVSGAELKIMVDLAVENMPTAGYKTLEM